MYLSCYRFIEHLGVGVGPCSQVFTNIYINNLGQDVNNTKKKDIFSEYGKNKEC